MRIHRSLPALLPFLALLTGTFPSCIAPSGLTGSGAAALSADQAPALAVSLSGDAVPAAAPVPADPPLPAGPLAFREVWAYLMDGEEKYLTPGLPVTDIGYFSAGLDRKGTLTGLPSRKKLKAGNARVHLVLAETGNTALTRLVTDPDLPLRGRLLDDLCKAAAEYDGVQIDFEAVHAADKDLFLAFLKDLKSGLGKKTLSVAIPARTRETREAWDYAAIAALADRVIIMAYDEHWSGSDPGPVASIAWGTRVADWARSQIPAEKLVMGLPFYGRSWQDQRLAKAYRHATLTDFLTQKGLVPSGRKDGIAWTEYQESVKVTVYWDDFVSTALRLDAYRQHQVDQVAFWRLGQEDPETWKWLAVRKD